MDCQVLARGNRIGRMTGESACGARPPPGGQNGAETIMGSLGESRIGSPNLAGKHLASLEESRIGSPKTGDIGSNTSLCEEASRRSVHGRRALDRFSVVEVIWPSLGTSDRGLRLLWLLSDHK